MKPAESLLPGTDALKRSTVEISRYHDKLLVRYRRPDGYTHRQTFTSHEQAHAFFNKCTDDLAQRIKGGDHP